jgi:hypothetical protein
MAKANIAAVMKKMEENDKFVKLGLRTFWDSRASSKEEIERALNEESGLTGPPSKDSS